LREVTNAAFTKGGFDDIVERFSDRDRARFDKDGFTEQKHETLDGRIAQLQKDWKEKYGNDFNLTSAGTVFGPSFAAIATPPTAVAAGERTGPTNDQNREETNRKSDNNPKPERNVDRGDSISYPDATVVLAEGQQMPEVRIDMRREAMGRFKIDVPDTFTARQLYDNLLKELTIFDEGKSSWPDNPDEGYRMASHRVFMAVSSTQDMSSENKPAEGMPARPPIRDSKDTAPFPPPEQSPLNKP
jgi:hypothetical protein